MPDYVIEVWQLRNRERLNRINRTISWLRPNKRRVLRIIAHDPSIRDNLPQSVTLEAKVVNAKDSRETLRLRFKVQNGVLIEVK